MHGESINQHKKNSKQDEMRDILLWFVKPSKTSIVDNSLCSISRGDTYVYKLTLDSIGVHSFL